MSVLVPKFYFILNELRPQSIVQKKKITRLVVVETSVE